jgi:hypothetical protein
MKKILLLIYILLNISCASQSVKIKHIAAFSDKPIFTLIISNNETSTKSLKERYIKVSKEDLNILLDFIVSNKTNKKQIKKKEYPYGAFVVETQSIYNKKSYALEDTEISINYFKKLIAFLDTNNKKKLAEEFRKILIRLEIK